MLSTSLLFFFFNDTATTEIYTLSLHDALPICETRPFRGAGPASSGAVRTTRAGSAGPSRRCRRTAPAAPSARAADPNPTRSEEHTSELQSRQYLVCRLLLEKKKKKNISSYTNR